ncbi:MAG: hypothetical protein ACP5IM_03560 [Candidatus Bathyarchaeia archaeon]
MSNKLDIGENMTNPFVEDDKVLVSRVTSKQDLMKKNGLELMLAEDT